MGKKIFGAIAATIAAALVLAASVFTGMQIYNMLIYKGSGQMDTPTTNTVFDQIIEMFAHTPVQPIEDEPPAPTFTDAPENYFDDALFIGDSRTDGIRLFGNIKNATYFCGTGTSIYGAMSVSLNVSGYGQTTLPKLLQSGHFGKVYIMLGINDAGNDREFTINRYSQIVDAVRKYQPDAIIFLEANLHCTANKAASSPVFSKDSVDGLNKSISELANGTDIFYIDCNVLFDDENGYLSPAYASDGAHVTADAYSIWCNWLRQNAIIIQ